MQNGFDLQWGFGECLSLVTLAVDLTSDATSQWKVVPGLTVAARRIPTSPTAAGIFEEDSLVGPEDAGFGGMVR